MPPPPIYVFLTTIASQHALRQRQDFLLRTLEVKKIPFIPYDLASDEDAKKLWRRKAPADKQQLPGILVGGNFIGTFQDFEEAVEFRELEKFLRQDQDYDPDIDGPSRPMPEAKPVGVPGASTQHQMTPEHLKPRLYGPDKSPLRGRTPSGRPVNKRDDEFDVSTELTGYGLQGVMTTEDELRQLVEELGLGGDDAGDLVKGLSSVSKTDKEDKGEEPLRTAEEVVETAKDLAEIKTEQKVLQEEDETKAATKGEGSPEVKEEVEEKAAS